MNDVLLATRKHFQGMLSEIALGYAWITLLPSWRAGLVLSLFTFIYPEAGVAGLLGAACAWHAAMLAGASASERPVAVFNGLLSALFVAHVWVMGPSVLALSAMGGVLSGWLSVVLGRLSWNLVQLPILSIPFALVTWLTSAAGGSLSSLQLNAYTAARQLFGTSVDRFFTAFGSLYFMPSPWVGLGIVLVVGLFSRYYLLLAVLGYLAANAWLVLLGAAPEHLASTAWDSNAILAALLVGGLFASPSLLTAAHGILAAVFAAWLSLSMGRVLNFIQLVPFSVPFVLAAWLVMYAAVRNTRMAGLFNVARADLPERTFERIQVSRARLGSPGSVPLALPFMGVWTVSQGFSGQHTHKGLWRHALDFMVMKAGKSFTNRGNRLEDFFCYSLPVVSPAHGQVWRVVNDVPDNAPGMVNLSANWGNCVVIKLASGYFVLVAHLKMASVVVQPGAWVKPGDFIGQCGNSGRSPQPHIHLHVQTTEETGSPTVAFHLSSVMVTPPGTMVSRYQLAVVPGELSTLTSALEGDVRPLYLLAGRGVSYTVARQGQAPVEWNIRCAIDELGSLVLESSLGARCTVESTWAVFSCYERNFVPDVYFDIWLLACGYTPVSTQVEAWQDPCVPARHLPQVGAGLAAAVLWPWATFAHSNFQRHWDLEAQAWRQVGQHRQKVTALSTQTVALITPQWGCTAVSAQVGHDRYTLQATRFFQRPDLGVPGWDAPLQLAHF